MPPLRRPRLPPAFRDAPPRVVDDERLPVREVELVPLDEAPRLEVDDDAPRFEVDVDARAGLRVTMLRPPDEAARAALLRPVGRRAGERPPIPPAPTVAISISPPAIISSSCAPVRARPPRWLTRPRPVLLVALLLLCRLEVLRLVREPPVRGIGFSLDRRSRLARSTRSCARRRASGRRG
jgi:hypothetical protein